MELAELLEHCKKYGHAFSLFSLPQEDKVRLYYSSTYRTFSSIPDLEHERGFVFAPFQKAKHPVIFFSPEKTWSDLSLEGLEEQVLGFRPPMMDNPHVEEHIEFSDTPEDEYQIKVRQTVHRINQGRSDKVILSRVHSENLGKDFDAVTLFYHMRRTYPGAYCYLFYTPHSGLWIGASPESLLTLNRDVLKTIALAGTKADSQEPWTNKEFNEQRIVQQFIGDALKGYEDVIVDGPHTVKAGNVFHLKTIFSVDLENQKVDINRLINDLHPTPATGGIPKEQSMEIIDEIEEHTRGYYCGFAGPVNMHRYTRIFVNLRCARIVKDKIHLFIGGGITPDSDPEKEWEETQKKADTLLAILNQ